MEAESEAAPKTLGAKKTQARVRRAAVQRERRRAAKINPE